MTSFVGTSHRVYLGQLDMSGNAHQVNFGPLTREMKPATTFADGGYDCVKPGLMSGSAMVQVYQDWATGVLDDQISVGQLGTQYAFSVIPNPAGTVTAGDAAWLSRGLLGTLNPMMGMKGAMAEGSFRLPYDTAIVRSLVAHPSAARTSSSSGTAVALAGPTAAQSLYAGLHVTAYSGFTNVVFKIQSDDNSGFTSATDRITFTTATGTTSQFASVAGNFSTETHQRVTWTVTGSGSVTFTVVFGVI